MKQIEVKNQLPDQLLTHYWFKDTNFRGNKTFLNTGDCAGCWAWINWSNIGSTRSTLVWERQGREIVVNLVPILNDPSVLSAVDNMFAGSPAHRTSPIKAGSIPWRHVPDYEKDPARHEDMDMLVRIFFNFHVNTPWYCTNADGNISYYIVPYLDKSGYLGVYVDWWSYDFHGGFPFCAASISSALDRLVPEGMGSLQSMINSRLKNNLMHKKNGLNLTAFNFKKFLNFLVSFFLDCVASHCLPPLNSNSWIKNMRSLSSMPQINNSSIFPITIHFITLFLI